MPSSVLASSRRPSSTASMNAAVIGRSSITGRAHRSALRRPRRRAPRPDRRSILRRTRRPRAARRRRTAARHPRPRHSRRPSRPRATGGSAVAGAPRRRSAGRSSPAGIRGNPSCRAAGRTSRSRPRRTSRCRRRSSPTARRRAPTPLAGARRRRGRARSRACSRCSHRRRRSGPGRARPTGDPRAARERTRAARARPATRTGRTSPAPTLDPRPKPCRCRAREAALAPSAAPETPRALRRTSRRPQPRSAAPPRGAVSRLSHNPLPMPRYVYDFDEPTDGGRELLGGKGIGLAEMTQLGVPVPAGFTITTDACRAYMEKGDFPEGLANEVDEHLARLEETAGKRFGDPDDPLLVSVRSGAAISMPGMMDTILNVGLNDQATEGLARRTGNERFAHDSYRRLIQMYGETVDGIDAHFFSDALAHQEDDLPGLIETFRRIYQEQTGRPFPQDGKEQLGRAVRAVFDSWNTPRAQRYRRHN